jgi:putative CRISPR-associated protein (TIGR02619 family)
MKKIITTVGTSIFTNYMKPEIQDSYDDYEKINVQFEKLESEPAQNYSESTVKISMRYLKKTISDEWFKRDNEPNTKASAEIKSILAIAKDVTEDVEVYLLATDTVLSVLACELVKEWFSEYKSAYAIDIQFNKTLDVISKLQVLDKVSFEKEGLVNLISRFYVICENYFDNVILNITGGYKAIIPYITILGQVNKVPVKYIFEDTDTLIEIPLLPLTIDKGIFEKYQDAFFKLEENSFLKKQDCHHFATEVESCLEIDSDGNVSFNSLGLMLWEKYKSGFFFFYTSDEVWTDIQNQPDIQRILKTKFHIFEARQNKTEKKQDHYVYDDGDNNNRIYYFEVDGSIYIYKTFESESKAKAFINTPFEKTSEIDKAKLRKIEILG